MLFTECFACFVMKCSTCNKTLQKPENVWFALILDQAVATSFPAFIFQVYRASFPFKIFNVSNNETNTLSHICSAFFRTFYGNAASFDELRNALSNIPYLIV